MPDPRWSYFQHGTIGLHLTLNPTPALAPTARVYRRFLEHGIRLDDRELQALLAGRDSSIATIDHILAASGSLLGPSARLQVATELTDAIFARGLGAHLSREAPTALELSAQRGERAAQLLAPAGAEVGMADRLLRLLPNVGVSLTIHF